MILRATTLFSKSTIDGVAILGTITPPNTGKIFFENINLEAGATDVFSSRLPAHQPFG